MLFSKPHLVKGDKDVGAEAEEEEYAGEDGNGYEVGTHVPDKPGGREVQQDTAERAGINRYLQPFTRVGHGHDTGKDKYHDGDGEDMGMRRSQEVTIGLWEKQTQGKHLLNRLMEYNGSHFTCDILRHRYLLTITSASSTLVLTKYNSLC